MQQMSGYAIIPGQFALKYHQALRNAARRWGEVSRAYVNQSYGS